MNAADRFFAKVKPDPSGCLLWTGELSGEGYGRFTYNGRSVPAHRWLLERVYGPNHGLVTDHLCRIRACVRPSHLEFVTIAENTRRGVGAKLARERTLARTECSRGHELTEANIYLYVSRNGKLHRRCRTCAREDRRRPNRLAWQALNQRCIRANRQLLAAGRRVNVLHTPRGARVIVEVFEGDAASGLANDVSAAVNAYRDTAAALGVPV